MLASVSLCLLLSATVHVSQAINVYLSPSASYQRTILSPDDASAALSRHLGMEMFETLRDTSGNSYQEETFVGQGETSALILILNQADAQGLLLQFQIDALTLCSSTESSCPAILTRACVQAAYAPSRPYNLPLFRNFHLHASC